MARGGLSTKIPRFFVQKNGVWQWQTILAGMVPHARLDRRCFIFERLLNPPKIDSSGTGLALVAAFEFNLFA
jgi:hypothetical protein